MTVPATDVSSVVNVILNSSLVQLFVAFIALTSAVSPVLRFFHDRAENRFREREVSAQERIAAAAERTAEKG